MYHEVDVCYVCDLDEVREFILRYMTLYGLEDLLVSYPVVDGHIWEVTGHCSGVSTNI